MFEPILEKIASELYATEFEKKAFVEAFREGFEKKANWFTDEVKSDRDAASSPKQEAQMGFGKGLGEGAARAATGLAAALIGAGVVKGVNAISNHVSTSATRAKFDQALAHVLATSKVVKGSNPEKVKSFAETVYKFAPNVAGDANILSTVLSNALEGTEGMDPMSIKMLVDLESRHAQPVDNRLPGIRT